MKHKFEKRAFDLKDVEVREDKDGIKKINGYAAEFEKLSVPLFGFREKIRKGAFAKSLQDGTIKALWNHDSNYVLGSTRNNTLKLWEDDRGLAFELEPPNNTWGKDALESIKRGDTDGVSFGFETIADEWDHSNEDQAIRTLVDVKLHEISPTAFPAYPQTSVSARSIFNDVGIDFDALSNVIKRSEYTELTNSDKDLIRSTINVLNKYAGDVQENTPAEEKQERSTRLLRNKLKLKGME